MQDRNTSERIGRVEAAIKTFLGDKWFAKIMRGPLHFVDMPDSAHASQHQDGGDDELDLYSLDFLVGTTTGVLPGEIVAGTSPGGELGGTWASPTVDATHSGSAHHSENHANDVHTGIKVVRKTSDETTSSDAALSDDSHLLFAIAANDVWQFEFCIFADSAAGDIRVSVTVPSGATGAFGGGYQATDDSLHSDYTTTFGNALTFGTGVGSRVFVIKGVCVNSSNAGNVTLQWAQETSNAATLTVRANSYLVAHKIP